MEDLVQKAKARDADAFTALMQSQMQSMYKIARAILSSEADIEDAISETILTCWEKLDSLREPAWFHTWMTRILINKCNDLIRQSTKYTLPGSLPDEEVTDNGYANIEWTEALKRLDEKYRLVMMLYYVEACKVSEISMILDIPESTVRTQLSRGRQKLAMDCKGKGEAV
ncbi:MAG: sigma-70 family RNA polymerase sigma factor [Lachnospiraceae bacterium]|nr:sigma-70 family RNA polymerase sigma factor [Lachnospiraceae bacterium]